MASTFTLPSPVDLGFGPKFHSWRPDQLQAIEKVVFSTRRFVGLNMPTGAGKTLTSSGAALVHPEVKRALFLTSTKGLQDQLVTDLHELGLVDVRGQRNYPCDAVASGQLLDRYRRGRFTPGCDEGPCHAGIRCQLAPDRSSPGVRPGCAYYGRVFDAWRAELVQTNYAYWLASGAYGQGLGSFDLLVCDEAHNAADELENFLVFELTPDDARLFQSRLLDSTDVRLWQQWGRAHVGNLRVAVERSDQMPPADSESLHEVRKIKRVLGKIERLIALNPDEWIYEPAGTGAKFTPIRVSQYAEDLLFRGIKKVLLISATMSRKTIKLLGVDDEKLDYWECPSRFPVARRPIIHVNPLPRVGVDHRMSEAHKMMWRTRIDRIISADREDLRGIIHTVSYARMKDLVQHSDHRERFIIHDSGNTLAAIQRFKNAKPGAILVSPSIMTGFDFPYDECRWQIIGKVPQPSPSEILRIRKEIDPDYLYYTVMTKIVQAVGRGMRAPDDWCETFIVDDHFDWFYRKARKFAPRWFRDAFYEFEGIPALMEDPNAA